MTFQRERPVLGYVFEWLSKLAADISNLPAKIKRAITKIKHPEIFFRFID
jgi:hypothetical protein